MARINLLPPEIRTGQRSRRLFNGLLVACGIVVAVLALVYLVQRDTISNERDELKGLRSTQSQLTARVNALKEFEDLQTEIDTNKQTLAVALTGDVAWSRLLNDLSLIMPDNSWLVSMALNAAAAAAPDGTPAVGNTTFQGFTFDFPGLAGWLTRVARLDGTTFVYLTSGSKQRIDSTDVVSFGATASITDKLLSKRCQEAGKPCP
jgi:Tfp pilus assembly protein PilN